MDKTAIPAVGFSAGIDKFIMMCVVLNSNNKFTYKFPYKQKNFSTPIEHID